jgi:hypothetical protein
MVDLTVFTSAEVTADALLPKLLLIYVNTLDNWSSVKKFCGGMLLE